MASNNKVFLATLPSRQQTPAAPHGNVGNPAQPSPVSEAAGLPTPKVVSSQDPIMVLGSLLEKEQQQVQDDYRAFQETTKHLPGFERAEAFLQYATQKIEGWGEEEAGVYLVSRGFDCTAAIAKVRKAWNDAAQVATNWTTTGHPSSAVQTPEVEQLTTAEVFDFWEGADCQLHSIDATMLRAAEWFKFPGFGSWFRRLNRTLHEELLLCGSDPEVRIRSVVNLCRSPLAIKVMKRSLPLAMDIVELTPSGQVTPWTSEKLVKSASGTTLELVDNVEYAADLVFCVHRMRRVGHPAYRLMPTAIDCLRKYQRGDGSWPLTSIHDCGSVQVTAMALHALALSQPRGAKKMMAAGVKWLLSQQEKAGNWRDGTVYVDTVYLTVLVLDAIAAVKGEKCVTYLGPHAMKHLRTAGISRRRRLP